jgi:hypothetical protein
MIYSHRKVHNKIFLKKIKNKMDLFLQLINKFKNKCRILELIFYNKIQIRLKNKIIKNLLKTKKNLF